MENLSDKFDFYIVAADRDLGDKEPFNNIKIEDWITVGSAKVFYVNPEILTWKKISKIMNNIDYDFLYLNSFFSYKHSIIPMLLNKFTKKSRNPVVIAPRGQFSSGAVNLKHMKKTIYLNLVKILKLYSNIIWHATADIEKKDIQTLFGTNANIKVANNLTENYNQFIFDKEIEKTSGMLKIVFVSRIHPKKNLKKAIEFLSDIKGDIEFNIYGPLEDKHYWAECQKFIDYLPNNIQVTYKGIVNPKNIIKVFKEHHVFLFPTLGENFGHVISEALIGGCPVIISNETPWSELKEKKAGWNISLDNEKTFIETIQYCTDLDKDSYAKLSKSAFKYGKEMSNKDIDIKNSYNLFL